MVDIMNVDEIKALAKIMSDYGITEFSIDFKDECTITMKRGAEVVAAPVAAPVAYAAPVAAPAPLAAPVAPEAPAAPAGETIDSPLVGTFYRASSPDAEPFVSLGSKVTPDTVIGIVESMKVMNEVKAEKSGIIKDILVDNGQPVEFGQPLFVIG